jgi:hypothetical protein
MPRRWVGFILFHFLFASMLPLQNVLEISNTFRDCQRAERSFFAVCKTQRTSAHPVAVPPPSHIYLPAYSPGGNSASFNSCTLTPFFHPRFLAASAASTISSQSSCFSKNTIMHSDLALAEQTVALPGMTRICLRQ